MQIHQLQREHPRRRARQVGRGGKRGKTSGRGTKGQKARAGHKIRPEIRDEIKKLPKLRGHGKNSNPSIQTKLAVINLVKLEKYFAIGEVVSPETLVAKHLLNRVKGKLPVVKILGTGAVTKALTIAGCQVSASAQKQLEALGGTIK